MAARTLVAVVVFGLAVASVGLGAFYGYAAAEHYGWVLRRWWIYTVVGEIGLVIAFWLGPKPLRVAAILIILLAVIAGAGPALRFVHLGWTAP